MCGFAGFIGSPHVPAERRRLLAAMGAQLARRGPDDEQLHDDDRLAFVFRRLSIVDLPTGAQPIWNEDRTRFVAVNGEIYNHLDLRGSLRDRPAFRTRSDAEVVLHLYEERGLDAFRHLMGKFAVALWDGVDRRLVLARDRAGIKPLYYLHTDDLLLFGSELKALLVHPDCPRQIDWGEAGEVRGGHHLRAFVRGVVQLPGGSVACYEQGRLRTSVYWSIDQFFPEPDAPSRTHEEYADAYAELLADSVRRRLMSDVPIGGFLSGGVDSALVMAMASRDAPGLPAFHALERTTYLSGDSDAARRAAEVLGLDFHAVVFDHHDLLERLELDLDVFEYFVWLIDSPRFELEWLFKHELHRYAKTVCPDLKVMLLGQGADEFAGGYSRDYGRPHATWDDYLAFSDWMAQKESSGRAGVAAWLEPLLAGDGRPSGATRRSYHDEMRRRVGTLQNYNLWHEDRTAAAQGIEARVPFLDHRLLELLASIPARLHAELFLDKRLVRDVARRYLPPELTERPKIGFYNVHDTGSIRALTARLAGRLFPAFEERYLSSSSSLLSREAMRELVDRAGLGGVTGHEAAVRALDAMALAVFDRMCREVLLAAPPRGLDPPSPLVRLQGERPAWGAVSDPETPLWLPGVVVRLEAAVELLSPLSGDARAEVVVLRAGERQEVMRLEDDAAWVLDLLRELAQRRPLTVEELRARLSAPEDELAGALTLFLQRRWIFVVQADSLGAPAVASADVAGGSSAQASANRFSDPTRVS